MNILHFLRLANIIGTLPNTLTNGTTADATQVMADLNKIVNDVNSNAAPLTNVALLNATNTFTQVQVGVNATASANFPTAGQVQGNMNFGSDVGVANAFAINPTPAISAYADGMPFSFIARHMTGTTTTFSASGLAALNMVNPSGAQIGSAQIQVGAAVTVIADATNSKARLQSVTVKQRPTRTVLTSGTAQTYTPPINCTYINVRAVGGGGGGAATTTNAGTNGNSTTFGTLTAGGGSPGAVQGATPVAGGTASGGDINLPGGQGTGGGNANANSPAGGSGGSSYFGGGGGGGGAATQGGNGSTNTGGGGGGAGGNSSAGSSGGGAGAYCEKLITTLVANYTYTVGAAANGGAAGGAAGGNGAAGIIIIDEYYD